MRMLEISVGQDWLASDEVGCEVGGGPKSQSSGEREGGAAGDGGG